MSPRRKLWLTVCAFAAWPVVSHAQVARDSAGVRLADGRIAVANGASNEIRLFSRDGQFVQAFGRAGSGPGEFRRIIRLLRRGDTLVGVDGDSRAHDFEPAGRLARSLRPARRAGSRNPRRIGLGAGSMSYVLVTVPGYRTSPINGTPARQLLDAEGVVAASDSNVCAGYSDRLVITCYGPTGRARLRINHDVAPRAIREDERAMVRQAYLDVNRDAPAAVRQQMASAVRDFPFASTAPVFSRLVFGADGGPWVSPFDPGYGLPGPGAPLSPTTPQTWSVFAPDGAWSAEVTLPAPFVPFEFGRDYLVGVAFDDDDVERVVVWGLRR